MKYTVEEIDFLKKNQSTMTRKELTEKFNQHFKKNRTVAAIRGFCKRNGLLRPKDTWYFPAGHIPANKGSVGLTGANSGSFKKGHRPHNTLEVGAAIKREDGYTYIKVAEPNHWRPKHYLVWEESNTPVLADEAILFIDNNRENFSLVNLMKITKGELARMNKRGFSALPKELKRQAVYLIRLNILANKRRSKKKQ
ncbi:HNH endonuclease [Ignatzschineria rhizosphaerae]|uniref:HNH endonuclease n=1 Tax=Ignatzschineria rhizosphaerae TaxID=2923279 RepID=A0ABY3WY42_9GAMM|nr:HNH endonuclease [Ignatzschineria rhizosphaerae]UNM95531.1 HNH endonuclease [Ignatzschineria rhizosphaerae]